MTTLLYLSDTYQTAAQAQLLDIREHEKGIALILDQTIFYPQGGGQPCDQGTITVGEQVFNVEFVGLDPDGVVWHIGEFCPPDKGDRSQRDPEHLINEEVTLKINKDRRLLNARIHSAGHLLDIAVKKTPLKDLIPTKGFHFPEGAYVEYEGEIEDPQQYIDQIESLCQQSIADNLPIIAENLSPQQVRSRGIKAPPGKSARFIYFEGHENEGCGCGGTHVRSSQEIGSIKIRKIKSKKGVTRIGYEV